MEGIKNFKKTPPLQPCRKIMRHTKIFVVFWSLLRKVGCLIQMIAQSVKFNFMTVSKYKVLLSNCTKKSTNNAPIEYKYPEIFYGYLDCWLFRTVKTSRLRATHLYPLCFSRHIIDEQKDLAEKKNSCMVNNLLDILVCSIAEYFYSLFVFWLTLRARQNTTQLVKIFSDTRHQNV